MKRTQIGARLDQDLVERVREEAKRDRRPISMELSVLLEEALDARAKAQRDERLAKERAVRSVKKAAAD